MLLKDRIALVTGCGRGIGRSIAMRFAEEGATVYANARTPDSLQELEKEEFPGKIIPSYFDVRDADACKNALRGIQKEGAGLDILVNNAGIMIDALIGMVSMDNLEEIFQTNVFAPINIIQLASRLMKRKKGGSIINVSSIVGIRGAAGQINYSSSKGAVAAMTKSAAHELGPFGIRVNAVAPGYINTDMFNSVPFEKRERLLERVSLQRIGEPEDVANACLFFASDLSAYVSGQILGVDGDVA